MLGTERQLAGPLPGSGCCCCASLTVFLISQVSMPILGQDGVQGEVWFVRGELVGQGIKFYIPGSRTIGQNEIEPAEE